METHHKHSLHPANAFTEDSAQLIPHAGQQKAKQRYAKQRVHDAEDLSTFSMWRNVSEPCRKGNKPETLPWMTLSRQNIPLFPLSNLNIHVKPLKSEEQPFGGQYKTSLLPKRLALLNLASSCVCVCVSPIVVMTVPAKKKAELRSHRLLWLISVPAGFTPERMADMTCWKVNEGDKLKRDIKTNLLFSPQKNQSIYPSIYLLIVSAIFYYTSSWKMDRWIS